MALFRDLIRTIAHAEGMSEIAVTGIGQYLRDAGLISKHGRGRAAAAMTAEDATNLLIGVNASDLAKNSTEATNTFGGLDKIDEIVSYLDDDLLGEALKKPKNLRSCLVKLISAFTPVSDGSSELGELRLRITFYRPRPSAEIWLGYEEENEDPQETLCWLIFSSEMQHAINGDRSDSTTITEATISAVSEVLSQ